MEPIFETYPFRPLLSLRPLIDHLKSRGESHAMAQCPLGDLLSKIHAVPELLAPITDFSLLERHRDLIDGLMATVFPPVFWETDALAAMVPLSVEPFHASPFFRRAMLDEQGRMLGKLNVGEEDFDRGRVLRAFLFVLEQVYGLHQEFDYRLIRTVQDGATGLERHFKIQMDFRFVRVHPVREPPPLDEDDRTRILDHIMEPEVLKDIIPPEAFELHGFTILKAVDVTESEVFSALERDLIDQDSIVSNAGFRRLQQRLQTLFRRKDLVAGLSAIKGNEILLLNSGCELTRSCIFADSQHVPVKEFEGTVFERAIASGKITNIPDILKDPSRRKAKDDILRIGIRSLLIAPLFYQGTCIGALDLGLPAPDRFSPMDIFRLAQLQPLFSMAIKRSLDDYNRRIQGVIMEKCTALHPTVEWRFEEAAQHYLESLRLGGHSEMEPIVFRDVYPLFGTSDIRGSSEERNRAIQNDFLEQLEMAFDVVHTANENRPFLILEELARRIRIFQKRLKDGLSSGDEVAVTRFLQREVESEFGQLMAFGAPVRKAIEAYREAIDPLSGNVYKLRRDFEESVSRLNESLSTHLDRAEAAAQEIIPHYYERRRTDGVDYTIFMGSSLLKNREFSELHLKSMRLWQLKTTCEMARVANEIRPSLKIPLETANLILFQSTPLSIGFRFDEKRFDVEGTYDLRYEVMKSRLDKAMAKGAGDRLTQPGMIAIVYTNPDEAREIRRHIDFLQSEGYLEEPIESLELEDMPGVQGLKALRVRVTLHPTQFPPSGETRGA